MEVGNVSFGNVVAVAGKKRNMIKFSNALEKIPEYKNGQVRYRNVSEQYKYAPRNGLMAQAAQRGDSVHICITGEDLKYMREGRDGWDTLDGILSQLTKFISVDRMSSEEAVKAVLKPGQHV